MAKAMQDYCAFNNVRYTKFEDFEKRLANTETVAVHFGSGRQLPKLVELCADEKIPLIQASSGLSSFSTVRAPIVHAPNLALEATRFLSAIEAFFTAPKPEDMEVTITESHQAKKKPGSATADAIIKIAGKGRIISIRDKRTQLLMGVPPEFLDGHAYHWITIETGDVTTKMSLAINGLKPYAAGGISLARKIVSCRERLFAHIYSQEEIYAL
jgi:dihydrodipicolinate reductase